MRIPRIVPRMLAVALVMALAVELSCAGLVAGPAPAGAESTVAATSRACARLRSRVAQVPAWQDRIGVQIARLEAQLDRLEDRGGRAASVRAEQLSARLGPLRRLAARLDAQVADVERRCG